MPVFRNILVAFLLTATAAQADEDWREAKPYCDVAVDRKAGGLNEEFKHKELTRKQCAREYRTTERRLENWHGNIGYGLVGCMIYCQGLYPDMTYENYRKDLR